MDFITLYVIYGSHTDYFTLPRNTTWSALCTAIQDRSGLPVTRLYHHNVNGNIEILTCDGDLKSLVYGCSTSWLRLSIGSTESTSLPCSLNTQQDGLATTTLNDSSSRHDKTYFTTQFESFGKLMDKYNDLIQRDDQTKTMMHDMAIRLTTLHQESTVDLAEIEARLEKRLGNATTGTNRRRSAIGDISAHDRVSLAFYENDTPGLSRSTTLSSSSTVPSPLYNHVKRIPTAPSHTTSNKLLDQPRTTSPSSYKPRQIVKSTIQGEWPAYSSLYPPPQQTHTMNETNLPTRHDSSPSLSLLDSNIIHEDHPQKSSLSLYPQPPMIASQSDRRVDPYQAGSHRRRISAGMPSQSTMKPNAISDRLSTSYRNDNYDSKSSSRNSRQLDWYHDDDDERSKTEDPWRSSQKRQSYKEQHRALKSQQKELERAIRQLKRQEKLEKKEYRKTLQHNDNNNNGTLIRKSSSLLSLSSSDSSIYSASSAMNDSCLQQQNDLDITCYLPSSPIHPSTERPYSDTLVGRRDYYGLDSKDHPPHHRFGIDKTSSHDNGGGVTSLADSLDRLSMTQDSGPFSSPVV